jgi:phosphohistidine phosphatase
MLLRHAKSSWTDPGVDDRERPLNPRGLKAAPVMGAFMRKEGLIPELVFCSPARRARETWRLVAEQLRAAPKVIVDEAIYDFGNGGRVAEAVRQQAGKAPSVLVAGHNPSLERLAQRLASDGDEKARRRMEEKFPTGALAVIDFAISDWHDLGTAQGILVSFTRPRDLQADT